MARRPTKPQAPPPGVVGVPVALLGTGAAAGAVGAAASSGAARLAVATSVKGAAKLNAGAVKAILDVVMRLSALRVARLRERLSAADIAPDVIEAQLREEMAREREFQARAKRRVEAALKLALSAKDTSAKSASIAGAIARERQYAGMRSEAMSARVYGAINQATLERTSPHGSFWKLGQAKTHTPDCIAMAGRFWPHSVLRRIHPPMHAGCVCDLVSMGAALHAGLMSASDIPAAADAERLAAPVIAYVDRERRLEEACQDELDIRVVLLERDMADPDLLAALPLAIDSELTEATDGKPSTGAMVALFPPPELATELALDGGEEPADIHVTLAFLGEAGGPARREKVAAAVRKWAAECPPLAGEISGTGRFVSGPKPVTYFSVDLPGLPAERERLVKALKAAGAPPSEDHGFTPHLTVAYAARRPTLTKAIEVTFANATLAWAEERLSVPLGGKPPKAREEEEGEEEEPALSEDFDPAEPRDAGGKWSKAAGGIANLFEPQTPLAEQTLPVVATAIDAVHTHPEGLPKIPIERASTLSRDADAGLVRKNDAPEVPHSIQLRGTGNIHGRYNATYSLLHEFGHYLDLTYFKGKWEPKGDDSKRFFASWGPRIFARPEDGPLRQLAADARNTPTCRKLVALRPTVTRSSQETIEYLLRPQEIFARAYAQWIAMRSGDEHLMDALRYTQEHADVMTWPDEEFAPIGEALDKLFAEHGWLKK